MGFQGKPCKGELTMFESDAGKGGMMARIEVWRDKAKVGYFRPEPMAVVDEHGAYLRPVLTDDMLKMGGEHAEKEDNQQT